MNIIEVTRIFKIEFDKDSYFVLGELISLIYVVLWTCTTAFEMVKK